MRSSMGRPTVDCTGHECPGAIPRERRPAPVGRRPRAPVRAHGRSAGLCLQRGCRGAVMGARAGLWVLARPHCDGSGGACRNRGASDRGGRRCDPSGRRLPSRRSGILRSDDRGRGKTGRSRCAPHVRSSGSPASGCRVAGGNTFLTRTDGRNALSPITPTETGRSLAGTFGSCRSTRTASVEMCAGSATTYGGEAPANHEEECVRSRELAEQVLRRARELIAEPECWTSGALARDEMPRIRSTLRTASASTSARASSRIERSNGLSSGPVPSSAPIRCPTRSSTPYVSSGSTFALSAAWTSAVVQPGNARLSVTSR